MVGEGVVGAADVGALLVSLIVGVAVFGDAVVGDALAGDAEWVSMSLVPQLLALPMSAWQGYALQSSVLQRLVNSWSTPQT